MNLRNYKRYLAYDNPTDEQSVMLLLNKSADELNAMSMEEVADNVKTITDLLERKDYPLVPKFRIEDTTYGFIPNLNDMTFGENKDLTKYISDYDTMERALAVAYRPITQQIGDKYLIEEYKGSGATKDIMLNVPLDIVFGMQVFFWTLTRDLLKAIPNYMVEQVENQTSSQESGAITKRYINSLKETLDDMMR